MLKYFIGAFIGYTVIDRCFGLHLYRIVMFDKVTIIYNYKLQM